MSRYARGWVIAGTVLFLASGPFGAAEPPAEIIRHGDAVPERILVRFEPELAAQLRRQSAAGMDQARIILVAPFLGNVSARLGVGGIRPVVRGRASDAVRRAARHFAARSARVPLRLQSRYDELAAAMSRLFVVDYDASLEPVEAARLYAEAPGVELAEPDGLRSVGFIPNDPFYSSSRSWSQPYEDLWGLHITNAATAWDV